MTGIELITMSWNYKEINVTSNQTSEQYKTEKNLSLSIVQLFM